MGRNKLKVSRQTSEAYTKTKRIMAKIPLDYYTNIKANIFPKYTLKNFQAVFDYLILGGVVYLNRDVVDLLDKNISFYKERDTQAKLARMKLCEPPKYPLYHNTNFYMYAKDYKAFNDFVIEKNYAKQWIIEIIFKLLSEENETIINFIKRGQDLKIRKRKKQVARLSEDHWIKVLPRSESSIILDQLTLNYEERKFHSNLQGEIDKMIKEKKSFIDEDKEDEAFANKMEKLRLDRVRELNQVLVYRDEKKA